MRERNCKTILELGCGQGRDSLFFAREGYSVIAVDASKTAIGQMKERVAAAGLGSKITSLCARLPDEFPRLPRVDAVYSHLFYCMPFTNAEISRMLEWTSDRTRTLGLNIFSIRDKMRDKSYGAGTQISKDTYQVGDFKIRFFSKDEMLKLLGARFHLLKMEELYEEPCSLDAFYTVRI